MKPSRDSENTDPGSRRDASSRSRITIVVDNMGGAKGLGNEWGFSAILDIGKTAMLFDTGASGDMLIANLAALGRSADEIDALFISHDHSDHTGGLETFLRERGDSVPPVFLPDGFVPSKSLGATIDPRYAGEGDEILPGIFSTGTIPGDPRDEQALIVPGVEGLVVMTGCAHPGIDTILARVRKRFDAPIDLVLGGFHLFRSDDHERETVYDLLDGFGIRRLAPSHCTGDPACAELAARYPSSYLSSGLGRIFDIEVTP